jgi:hypothetical protein
LKRLSPLFVLLFLLACDSDENSEPKDAGSDSGDNGSTTCELSKCAQPEMGIACCTPLAQCGFDPTGIGLSCVPNPDETSGLVCALDDCPKPAVGAACCTPFAQCGFDPTNTGLFCFANAPEIETPDAGALCDLSECPATDGGPTACCLPNGKCGVDTWELGICFLPPPEAVDAGTVPPVSTDPPNDPSVNGECPSYLGFFGPVWGCCSDYGVCGTWGGSDCLIPTGTAIPVDSDEDAGAPVFPYCNAPATTPE